MKDNYISLANNDNEWDEFQKQSSQENIFSYSKFINSLNIVNDKVYLRDKENILASSVIFDLDENTVPYSMYQGMCIKSFQLRNQKIISKTHKIILSFIDLLTNKYDKIFMSLSPYFTDLRPFLWYNYHADQLPKFNFKLRYTGIIETGDFSDFNDYLETIRSVRKQEIKKAKNEKLFVSDSQDIDTFIKLYKLTFARQDIDVKNIDIVYSIVKSALDNDYGSLFICYNQNNEPLSAIVILYDTVSAYYSFGATDPKNRNSGASTLLMIECIKKIFNLKLKRFDMCGVNSPNRGDFKLSFNAKLLSYFDLHINL